MHSVQEFLERVFAKLQLDWKQHVAIDERYFRPTEVDLLIGDASKARAKLAWRPSMTFEGLIDTMIEHDLRIARQEDAAARV